MLKFRNNATFELFWSGYQPSSRNQNEAVTNRKECVADYIGNREK